MTQLMTRPKFSKTELKVQALARRHANTQLLRVPWVKFRRAYEDYPRWHALTLWVRGIVAMQDSVPSWLVADLRKRCPEFIEHEEHSREPNLIALHLLEWIHNQEFGYAKRQGWLDALTFYGVRHPRSECAWAYWERCETEWNRKRENEFPLFDEWWHAALQMKLCESACYSEVSEAVETYIDWKAVLLWLHPLFASDISLPQHVLSDLGRWCPGILQSLKFSSRQSRKERSRSRQLLVAWGKDRCLSKAREAGWLDCLLERTQRHPRQVRLLSYGRHFAKEWSGRPKRPYPSFHQWRQSADRYIKSDLH